MRRQVIPARLQRAGSALSASTAEPPGVPPGEFPRIRAGFGADSATRAILRHALEHVPLDPEMREDLAGDLLDRSVGGVERGNALALHQSVRQQQFAPALFELRV